MECHIDAKRRRCAQYGDLHVTQGGLPGRAMGLACAAKHSTEIFIGFAAS